VEPPVTITLGGTVRLEKPVLLSVTATPLAGAACDSVTQQSLLEFEPSVVALHCSEETAVAAARLRLTDCDVPL
jgi:hypothetical protein